MTSNLKISLIQLPLFWENALKNRARIAKEEIIAKLVTHCNSNSIALAVGEDAQVTQAYDLGVVIRAADIVDSAPA